MKSHTTRFLSKHFFEKSVLWLQQDLKLRLQIFLQELPIPKEYQGANHWRCICRCHDYSKANWMVVNRQLRPYAESMHLSNAVNIKDSEMLSPIIFSTRNFYPSQSSLCSKMPSSFSLCFFAFSPSSLFYLVMSRICNWLWFKCQLKSNLED